MGQAQGILRPHDHQDQRTRHLLLGSLLIVTVGQSLECSLFHCLVSKDFPKKNPKIFHRFSKEFDFGSFFGKKKAVLSCRTSGGSETACREGHVGFAINDRHLGDAKKLNIPSDVHMGLSENRVYSQ